MNGLDVIALIGQGLGIMAMVFSTLSFQMSNHKKIMIVGMVVNTLSFSFTNPQWVRITTLVLSPLLLVYNIFTLSVGGITNELLAEASVIIGLIRYRSKGTE